MMKRPFDVFNSINQINTWRIAIHTLQKEILKKGPNITRSFWFSANDQRYLKQTKKNQKWFKCWQNSNQQWSQLDTFSKLNTKNGKRQNNWTFTHKLFSRWEYLSLSNKWEWWCITHMAIEACRQWYKSKIFSFSVGWMNSALAVAAQYETFQKCKSNNKW